MVAHDTNDFGNSFTHDPIVMKIRPIAPILIPQLDGPSDDEDEDMLGAEDFMNDNGINMNVSV